MGKADWKGRSSISLAVVVLPGSLRHRAEVANHRYWPRSVLSLAEDIPMATSLIQYRAMDREIGSFLGALTSSLKENVVGWLSTKPKRSDSPITIGVNMQLLDRKLWSIFVVSGNCACVVDRKTPIAGATSLPGITMDIILTIVRFLFITSQSKRLGARPLPGDRRVPF